MRVALAQINSHLGDFEANYKKIIDYSERARDRRCDVVLFPEATLFGYHPMDLLERASVVNAQLKYLKKLSANVPKGLLVVFGAFTQNTSKSGKPYFNSAVALQRGKKPWTCHKELLPTYDVFDDARHIEPGDMSRNILTFKGKKILITICEDIWAWPVAGSHRESHYDHNPLKKIKPGSVDLVLNLSASPFFSRKMEKRLFVTCATARYLKAPMAYVNMVGGQDELIFDGGSFAIDVKGKILAQNAQFVEDLNVVDFSTGEGGVRQLTSNSAENLRQALVMGIADFMKKTGQERAHLGLSGGIDSAVVACLAVDAVGPENVKVFAIPGPFSSKISLQLAQELASNLGVELKTISINREYKGLIGAMEKACGKTPFGLMHENIQARLRGLLLMAFSNRNRSLLLNTSNKSEFAAGYGTLYGDMAGGLSPIGDLLKGDIYKVARLYNTEREIIPRKIITRAPSAELRPNQKDEDTLPPYTQLDQSVVNLVERLKAPRNKSDRFLLEALMRSEFKRWQSPPILKVREHSFGQGRRLPIAHRGVY